jgi:nucleotide-binding universal stress UspA family protein
VNILVAVDLSLASEKVVEAARDVAEKRGAKVYVVHVAEPDPDFVGYGTASPGVRQGVAREFRREHRGVQLLADQLRAEGLDATGLLLRGVTVDRILEEADRLQATTIVIGTHGHRAVYDVLVGSVSAGVIRKSTVPILVVPTH